MISNQKKGPLKSICKDGRGEMRFCQFVVPVAETKLVLLFLLGLATIQAMVFIGIRLTDQHWPEPGALVAFALVFAAIGIATFYVVWGRSNVATRVVSCLAIVATGSLVLTQATRSEWTIDEFKAWMAIMSVYTASTFLPLLFARFLGVAIACKSGRPLSVARRKGQFTLLDLLSYVTIGSIVLSLVIQLDFGARYVLWRAGNLTFSFGWVTWASCVALFVGKNEDICAIVKLFLVCIALGVMACVVPLGVNAPWVRSFMAAAEFHEGDYILGANPFQYLVSVALYSSFMLAFYAEVRKSGIQLVWRRDSLT